MEVKIWNRRLSLVPLVTDADQVITTVVHRGRQNQEEMTFSSFVALNRKSCDLILTSFIVP